ncbi:MAG: hypothetical protein V4850_29725 [Myxococcota bacterium]
MEDTFQTLADADRLEHEAWNAIGAFELEGAARCAGAALEVREQEQGTDHADIIWPLALWIEALLRRHDLASAKHAALLGERRLGLQGRVLAGAPGELERALREQIGLYSFEYACFNGEAVATLEKELGSRTDGEPNGR